MKPLKGFKCLKCGEVSESDVKDNDEKANKTIKGVQNEFLERILKYFKSDVIKKVIDKPYFYDALSKITTPVNVFGYDVDCLCKKCVSSSTKDHSELFEDLILQGYRDYADRLPVDVYEYYQVGAHYFYYWKWNDSYSTHEQQRCTGNGHGRPFNIRLNKKKYLKAILDKDYKTLKEMIVSEAKRQYTDHGGPSFSVFGNCGVCLYDFACYGKALRLCIDTSDGITRKYHYLGEFKLYDFEVDEKEFVEIFN